MSDIQLTIAAATVEIGLAVLVLLVVFFVKPFRRRAIVVLGAITPAIAVMIQVAYSQFIDPTSGSMVAAGWVMGFAAYAVIFVGGAIMSLIPRPTNLYGRYLLGLASAPMSVGLLVLIA